VQDYTQQVEAAEQHIEEKVQAAETDSGTYDGHNQAYEAAERTVVQLREQMQPVEEERDAAKGVFDANKNELLEIQGQQRRIRDDLKHARIEVKGLEEQVRAEQERLASAEGPEHVQRLERLEQLKTAAQGAERRQMEHGTGVAELQRKRDEAFKAETAAKPALAQARETLDRARVLYGNLQRDQGRPFEAYRNNMEQLVRAVNNETRWRSKPVGPMGNHVRLLKPEWSGLIEKTFGGLLDSFSVTNAEDKNLLNQIMGRVNCRTAIYIGDPEPLNTDGKEPDEGIDTILRVLQVDNHAVRNAMIINTGVDQVALVRTHEEAETMVRTHTRNVKAAMCFANKGAGVRYELTRTGQQRSSPVEAWQGRPRIKTDREEQIRLQRDVVNRADQDLETQQRTVRQLQNDLGRANQGIKAFEAEQKKLKIAFQKAGDDVDALENEIESSRPQDGKLQELERQLHESRESFKVVENSFGDSVNQKDILGDKGAELKAVMDGKQRALDQAQAQLTQAEDRVNDLRTARRNALHQKNQALQEIDAAKHQVTELQNIRDGVSRNLEEVIMPQALAVSARVPVEEGVTADALDARLEKFSQDLAQMQREAGGTREELMLAYQKAKYEFDDAQSKLSELSTVAKVYCTIIPIGHVPDLRTNIIAGFEKHFVPTSPPLEDVPQVHHLPRAHHLHLPAQRAQLPRPRPHGPPVAPPRHQSRARPRQGVRRRPRDQDAVRW